MDAGWRYDRSADLEEAAGYMRDIAAWSDNIGRVFGRRLTEIGEFES